MQANDSDVESILCPSMHVTFQGGFACSASKCCDLCRIILRPISYAFCW